MTVTIALWLDDDKTSGGLQRPVTDGLDHSGRGVHKEAMKAKETWCINAGARRKAFIADVIIRFLETASSPCFCSVSHSLCGFLRHRQV